MGCGCKKKKAQMGATPVTNRVGEPQPEEPIVNQKIQNVVQENKAYQNKVQDALKQLMELKRRKRNLRA
tara:strand:- start:214 stop:420 length:207 start_codon:yes stop_codon:yes gene_type:complete